MQQHSILHKTTKKGGYFFIFGGGGENRNSVVQKQKIKYKFKLYNQFLVL